jgi:LysR family transcriptional regulator for metE and metH
MFEIKHLKTLTTLAETGNLRKASELLFSSQSALSHQIKDLEHRLNTPLFIRNTSPVEFTDAGRLLLNLGEEFLPKIQQVTNQLKSPDLPISSLKIAIACHACFQWLLPVTSEFSHQNKSVELEFLDEAFTGNSLKQSSDANADIFFTDENSNEANYVYQEIGQFEVIAVLSKQLAAQQNISKQQLTASAENKPFFIYPTATIPYLQPEQFRQFTLLTYPLPPEQLDIFKWFLTPAKCKPYKLKQVGSSHVMLQMVAANMGVATLPDWLVNTASKQSLVDCMRLGKSGVYKKLYARYNKNSAHLAVIQKLLPAIITEFSNLYREQQ